RVLGRAAPAAGCPVLEWKSGKPNAAGSDFALDRAARLFPTVRCPAHGSGDLDLPEILVAGGAAAVEGDSAGTGAGEGGLPAGRGDDLNAALAGLEGVEA